MNGNRPKMLTELTDDELLSLDRETAEKAKSVFVQGIDQMKYQLDRISQVLSDFTQRTALFMTIAGLLSFLPPIVGLDEFYLKHFLIWTFPFLVLSLVCTYFSSTRITGLATQIPTAATGTPEELLILRSHTVALETIWKKSKEWYDRVLVWYRYASMFIYLYILSLVINFYIFVFIGKPDICSSILLTFSLLILGIWTILRYQLMSSKNLNFGPKKFEMAVGGIPNEKDIP